MEAVMADRHLRIESPFVQVRASTLRDVDSECAPGRLCGEDASARATARRDVRAVGLVRQGDRRGAREKRGVDHLTGSVFLKRIPPPGPPRIVT